MISKLFKRKVFLIGLILMISMMFGVTVFAADENARYVMDAETMKTGHIGVLFIKGGTSSSGIVSGGNLYFGTYDPGLEKWTEEPVGETAPVAKEAALTINSSGACHVAYITSDDKIAYTHRQESGWTEPVVIESNNANGAGTPDTLSCIDIAIDTEDNVYLAYIDNDGAADGDYRKADGMLATNKTGLFVKTVIANCTGYGDSWGKDYTEMVKPIKVTYGNSGEMISFNIHSYSWTNGSGRSDGYTFHFKATEETTLGTDGNGRIYETVGDGANHYTLLGQSGKYFIANGNTKIDATEKEMSIYAADMTLDGSDIYYAAINDTTLLFYQNGTFIEGKQAKTGVLSGHNKCATVIISGEQFIVYTGSDADKSLIITTVRDDEVVEYKVPNITYWQVEIDPNNEEIGSNTSVEDGTKIILPEASTFTAPEGTAFGGWKIGDSIYNAGATYTVESDITIQAQWYTIVTNPNCTITKPVSGQTPDMSPVSSDSEKYTVSLTCVYLYEGSYPNLNSGDVYEGGKKYSYRIRFTAQPGYIFDSTATTFTVNGDSTSSYGRLDERELQYTAQNLISTITISGDVLPIGGENPNFDIVSAIEGCTLSDTTVWRDVTNGNAIMENTDTFIAGNTYQLEVCFVPSEGYIFAGIGEINATIQGLESTEYATNVFTAGGGDYPNRVVYYKFSDIAAPVKTQLTIPTLAIDEFTYDKGEKTVTINNLDATNCTVTGTQAATTVGNYTVTVTINDTNHYEWSDGTTEDKKLSWSIVLPDFAGSITVPSFENVEVGYAPITEKAITITILNTYIISPSRLTYEVIGTNASDFTINLNTGAGMLNGKGAWSNIFFIKPNDDLAVGTYTATVTLKYDADNNGSYELTIGSGDVSFTVEPKDITATLAISAIADQTYTGDDIEPTIEVTDGIARLTLNKDYIVSYENNLNRGTATVKITKVEGSNYTWTGEKSQTFIINPKTITPTIEDIADQDYTGAEIKPSIVVKDEATTLNTTEYKVIYSNNINTGIASVSVLPVSGKNYKWDDAPYATKTFTILPYTIKSTEVALTSETAEYTGSEIEIGVTVTVNETTLVKDTDYIVTYTDNKNTGTATVKVEGKGNYEGTVNKNFTINAAHSTLSGIPVDVTDSDNTTAKVVIGQTLDISNFVTLDPEEYKNEIGFTLDTNTIGVTLNADGKTLDATSATGEGTVSLKASFGGWDVNGDGKKDYAPATDLTFYVKVVDKEVVTISGLTDNQEITYNGNPVSLSGTITVSDGKVPVNELEVNYQGTGKTDYDSTTAPKDAGTYTVTYKVADSNENYTGSVTYAFTIKKVELTKPTLSGTYTYNETEQTATLENFDAATMNVTNNTRTEAGSQNITVSLKDTTNYAWADGTTTDVIIPFEIAKTTPTIAIDNLSQKEGSVTSVTYTVTPATTDGTVKVEYKVSTADDTTYTETLPTTKGTYTVKVSIAGDSNLEDAQNTETLTITRKTTGGGGGSSATTKYTITVKQNSNGKISPETIKVEKGNDQKFEIKANDGYEIEDVKVDGKSVGAVKRYTFENVKATHTIEATFKKVEEIVPVEPEDGWKNPFLDVSEDDWYYEAVKFANENKLFNGVSENEFGANVKMTRGMLVTVLYRLAGEPATNKSIPFADVDTAMYYANPISWAKQNGIVNGVDENNFAPNAEISRQQLVTILYRFAKLTGKDVSVGEDTNILSYDDVNQVAEYAIPAMQWACGDGVITGRTESTLAPIGNATRAEVATMLMRFINN